MVGSGFGYINSELDWLLVWIGLKFGIQVYITFTKRFKQKSIDQLSIQLNSTQLSEE